MIRALQHGVIHLEGIPRESGDDPNLFRKLEEGIPVFPARAGMIPTRSCCS